MISLIKDAILFPFRLALFAVLYLAVWHPTALVFLLIYFLVLFVLFKTIRYYRL